MALVKVGKKPGIYQNQLTDGDIVYYYSFKHDGKKHNVKVGKKSEGITPTFAHNKRVERLNLLKHGEDPLTKQKKKTIRFEDVWTFYIDNAPLADKVRTDRRGRWTKHMEEYFSDEVTVDKLKKFRSDKTEVLSPTSIDMLLAFCGTAVNFWNAEQRLRKTENQPFEPDVYNPLPDLRAVDSHKQTKNEKIKKINRERFLSKEEIDQLKEEVKDKPELNLFVHLALTTGARLGTVMSIQKKSIRDGKVTLINHKVGKSKYTGFIDATTQKLLEERLSKLKVNDTLFFVETLPEIRELEKEIATTKNKEKKAAREKKLEEFIESNTRKLQRRLQYIMNKLFNEGLESKDTVHRVMVHTLRHTFASHLVMNGVPLVTVKELMGHKDINTTMIYAHLAPDAGKNDVMELWS